MEGEKYDHRIYKKEKDTEIEFMEIYETIHLLSMQIQL